MKLIIARNLLFSIGLNDTLPWRSKEDLKHFKEKTLGQKLLVGRKTFESLPPLKNRELIVVGKGYNTLEQGLAQNPDWVIGGKSIYEQTSHLCDEIHISDIIDRTKGDTFMSELKYHKDAKIFYYTFQTS